MIGKIKVEFVVTPVDGQPGHVTVHATTEVPGMNRVTKTPCLNKVSSGANICLAGDVPGYCCVALMELLDKIAPKPPKVETV